MKSTKELARELGLLRKRVASSNNGGRLRKTSKRPATCSQTFSYVVVIDFESTCWKDKKNTSQEIIEFPAVLLNTCTGQVECEFRQYVMPDECPVLSEFCRELTGITQDQVDNGVPLFICLSRFSNWLKKIEVEKNVAYNISTDDTKKLCTFVTWSDWDLAVCLHYECQRKQLYKPSALTQWIDVRAVYRSFYQRKPQGLNGALQELGIEFAGRQHSGLDDARNTARLVWRMVQDGCLLNITKTLKSGKLTSVTHLGVNQYRPALAASTAASLHSKSDVLETITSLPQDCTAQPTEKDVPSTTMKNSVNGTPCSPVSREGKGCVDTTEDSSLSVGREHTADSRSEGRASRRCSKPITNNDISRGISNGETPNCSTITKSSDHRTPPAYSTPLFNQNAITKYGKLGEKTSAQIKFKTPVSNKARSSKVDVDGFKTPSTSVMPVPCAKITPPMCKCGRRSKRRVAVRPGPNQGRAFYSCPCQRRGSGSTLKDSTNAQRGCGYFCWESSVLTGFDGSPTGGASPLMRTPKPRTPSPLALGSIQKVIQQRNGHGTRMAMQGGVTPIGMMRSNSWR